jgi:hypothetical protein
MKQKSAWCGTVARATRSRIAVVPWEEASTRVTSDNNWFIGALNLLTTLVHQCKDVAMLRQAEATLLSRFIASQLRYVSHRRAGLSVALSAARMTIY